MTRLDKITKKGIVGTDRRQDPTIETTTKVKTKGIVGDTSVFIRRQGCIFNSPIKDIADPLFDKYSGYIIEKDDKEIIMMEALPTRDSLELWSLDVQTGNQQWQKIKQISRARARGCRDVKTASGNNIRMAMSQKIYAARGYREMFVDTTFLNIGDMIPSIRELPRPDKHINTVDVIRCLDSYKQLFVKLREDVTMDMIDEFEYIPRKIRYFIVHKPMRVGVEAYVESGMIDSPLNLAVTIDAGKPVGQIPVKLPLTDDMISFFGYYAARGRVNDRTVVLKLINKESIQKTQELLATFDLPLFKLINIRYHHGINSTTLARIMRSICGSNHTDNRLPKFWPQLDDRKLGILLRAFFDCYANFDTNQLYTRVDNDGIGGDLQLALTRFGITSRILTKYVTDKKGLPKRLMQIKINGGSNLALFQKHIGFGVKKKQALLDDAVSRNIMDSTQVDFVPIPLHILPRIRRKLKLSKLAMSRMANSPKGYVTLIEEKGQLPLYKFTYNLVKSLKGIDLGDDYLTERLGLIDKLNNFTWSQVETIGTLKTTHTVYDFVVEGGDAYLAGNGGMFLRSKNPK